MSTPMIPRKEIARKELPGHVVEEPPPPAYLKTPGPNGTATAWDGPEEGQGKRRRLALGAGTGWAISDRIDRILPPHKRYLGRSRRALLIVIGVAVLCLLALIIGLAVGLSNKSK